MPQLTVFVENSALGTKRNSLLNFVRAPARHIDVRAFGDTELQRGKGYAAANTSDQDVVPLFHSSIDNSRSAGKKSSV